MNKNLSKNYDPKSFEDRIYKWWLEEEFFHEEVDRSKKPFSISMPPPNVTGKAHMGHAMDNTLQDILIRMKRMQGYNTAWIPGTDHAAIATEVKVIKKMLKDGYKRKEITREKFLEEAWKWTEKYGDTITNQLKKMGISCDWQREAFTLDENLSDAVTESFIRLYEKGYIYRGKRIINWCPNCETSISDAEVEHREESGHFWHIKYHVVDSKEELEIATTRPETMLGDTALAVNPKDERYSHLVGKKVVLPIVGREIPVISDRYVDMDFGTGIVKITPSHDPNDFEVGKRNNLEMINVMNDDGTINENGGKFEGQDRYEARKNIVEELEEIGHLVKVEDHNHNVGTHDRCGTVIEPLSKLQWFVKMEEMAKKSIDVYNDGELNIVPERFGKVYLHWLENIKDWCISRQLWWGHRMPIYYCNECHHVVVSKEDPGKCEKCGHDNFRQEEDVLDTWFSSALWPFSVLGWPEKTEEFEQFYPNNVLVTGHDIIFFWVIRMVFSGLEHTGELPFKDVLLHGLVRAEDGRKMSKSLGNGIDPIDVIEDYGADALRFMLASGSSLGNDMRFSLDKVEASRNFANKIWNATRFIMMNVDGEIKDVEKLNPEDKWIISKFNTVAKEVTENIDNYDFGVASSKIHDFIKVEFCDWYIEMVKPRLYDEEDQTRDAALYTLNKILTGSLKLLHPYMPFITEEIFKTIQNTEETILFSKWPEYTEEDNYKEEEKEIELMKEAVRNIRNIKAEMNVKPSKKINIHVVSENKGEVFEKNEEFFKVLSNAEKIYVKNDKQGIENDAVSAVINGCTLYVPLGDLVDLKKELARLEDEKNRLISEIKRVDGKLANDNFVNKAPKKVVDEERKKKEKYQNMLNEVEERIENVK